MPYLAVLILSGYYFFSPGLRNTLALTNRHFQNGGAVVYGDVHTGHLWGTALVTWSQRKISHTNGSISMSMWKHLLIYFSFEVYKCFQPCPVKLWRNWELGATSDLFLILCPFRKTCCLFRCEVVLVKIFIHFYKYMDLFIVSYSKKKNYKLTEN